MNHCPVASRIDFFLISENLLDCAETCGIKPGCFTDHSLVTLGICTDNYKHGVGVWKFNNLMLNDENFCKKVEQLIDLVKGCTCDMNSSDQWETLKMVLTSMSKRFTINIARNRCCKIKELEKKKADLQELILNCPRPQYANKMKVLDTKLEEISRAKALGSIFRFKSNFARGGEKCSAFFLSLEKKRYLEKNMKSVYKSDGTLTYCQKEILDTRTDFYKDLYQADPKIKFHLKPEPNERILNNDEKCIVEKPFMLDEFFDAMMTLKSNKFPGVGWNYY